MDKTKTDKKGQKGQSPRLQVVPEEGLKDARAIPNSLEAERAVLSSMLQDPVDRIGEAVEAGLRSQYLYLPVSYTHLTLPTTPYV